jgi:hypothetical protein
MTTIKKILKVVNALVVKIVLSLVYFIIIWPYRLLMKKPSTTWKESKQTYSVGDMDKMW